jgi:hypothetical protein
MAQSKILVDTNVYLRLAQSVKPLLFVPFGDKQFCLYVIPELNSVTTPPQKRVPMGRRGRVLQGPRPPSVHQPQAAQSDRIQL